MDLLHKLLDVFHRPGDYLNQYGGGHPVAVYAVLALIVFCETGLVVMPFLPGDSLLFAVGAVAASSGVISLPVVVVVLCLAANAGDLTNYFMGRAAGPRVFFNPDPTAGPGGPASGQLDYAPAPLAWWQRLLSRKHLAQAQAFYERHGRKTIILARFVPIVRTFAPFVAGVGRMTLPRFIGFSVGGGLLWVVLMTGSGYLFGNIPWVKAHFEVVVLAIVFISVIPVVVHAVQGRRKPAAAAAATVTGDVNA